MNIKLELSVVVYGLALFSGVSYLWGFWLNFDINILSYIALTDVIKASVYPALPALGVLAFYSAMDGYNSMSKAQQDTFIAEGGFSKGFTYFHKLFCLVCFIFGLGNAIYLVASNDGYFRLLGLYPLVSICLFIYLVMSNKFLMSISVKYRVFVFIIICFLPTFLFNKGYSNGVQQSDLNAEGQYVIADGFCSSDDQAKYRFVSVIGGKLFSISSLDESICVRSAENFRLVKYNQTDGDSFNTNEVTEVETAS